MNREVSKLATHSQTKLPNNSVPAVWPIYATQCSGEHHLVAGMILFPVILFYMAQFGITMESSAAVFLAGWICVCIHGICCSKHAIIGLDLFKLSMGHCLALADLGPMHCFHSAGHDSKNSKVIGVCTDS